SWGQGNLGPWLNPGLRMNVTAGFNNVVARFDMPGFAGTWTVDFVRSGGVPNQTFLQVREQIDDITTVTRSVTFDATAGTVELAAVAGFPDTPVAAPQLYDDNPHHIRFTVAQDGADAELTLFIDGELVDTLVEITETVSVPIRAVINCEDHDQIPFAVGHLAVWATPPPLADAVDATFGHPGEPAGRRIERLCAEQGIPFTSVGDLDDTTPMGAQGPRTPLELMAECADTDHGILYEPRATLGLAYRTRASLYKQTPALELDYGDDVFFGLPEPVDDDQNTRNDVIAKRPHSGEARAVLETGPLSVADPPAGVGTYDSSVTVNVAGDGFLSQHASWLLALGTIDEARYPRLAFGLHTPPLVADAALAAALAAADLGDLLTLSNLPAWLPPDDVAALAVGMTEVLDSFTWDLELVTEPASVYTVGVYASAADPAGSKYDTDGCELASAIPATGSFSVTTTRGPLWTADNAEDGFDIYVGGERMTVTDIGAPSGSIQQFTVIRSVNGVVKPHPAGTPVRLWQPARIAL
ncbi:MAG: hypothetical protein ACRD0W_25025, partial [Acidimicrobiales bacterium]